MAANIQLTNNIDAHTATAANEAFDFGDDIAAEAMRLVAVAQAQGKGLSKGRGKGKGFTLTALSEDIKATVTYVPLSEEPYFGTVLETLGEGGTMTSCFSRVEEYALACDLNDALDLIS